MKRYALITGIGILFQIKTIAQTVTYDYSDPLNWTQVQLGQNSSSGGDIKVSNGKCNFNAVWDANSDNSKTDVRVWRRLPFTLNDEKWKAEFEFTTSGNDIPADLLLSLTSDSLNPEFIIPNTTNTTNNDMISIHYLNSSTGGNGDFVLGVESKDGGSASNNIYQTPAANTIKINPSFGINFYVRLERLSATSGKFEVFSDSGRTISLGSIIFPILSSIQNLKYLQHSTANGGGFTRYFSGSVDNTVITNPVETEITKVNLNRISFEIYPNPVTNHLSISFSENKKGSKIIIQDLMGRSLLEYSTKNSSEDFDIDNFKPGVYLVTLIQGNLITSKKFVKIN